MSVDSIAAAIRDIPDFPQPGIIFKDITPLLKDHDLFRQAIRLMAAPWRDRRPDYIAAVESRGFIFGAALGMELECGLIPVRKKGKLPFRTVQESYSLEYGNAVIEVHEDALKAGDRVLVIDDVLATGGTAAAAARLLEKLGATMIGMSFLLELSFLNGRSVLRDYDVNALIRV